jgi:hypothetical protein
MNKDVKIKIPVAKGLVYIKTLVAKVTDIKADLNTRKLEFSTVHKFQKAIREKTYNVELNTPPCVTENLELVSGNHKYNAHVLENQEYIIVALVKFIDFENMPAEYWRLNWTSVENNPDNDTFIRLPRTDDQIIQTTLNQIQSKLINPTETDVKKSLKDQQVTPERFNFFISEILHNTNNSSTICKVYNSDQVDDYINENFNMIVSTPKKIELNTDDNTVYFKQQFKKENDDKDYDNRVFNSFVKSQLKYPSCNVNIVAYVDSCNPNHILAVRNAKLKLIDNKINELKQFIKLYDEKKVKDLQFTFLPQLPDEFK